MNVEEFIDELEEMFESSWSLPLSGGKTIIDADKALDILSDIRGALPNEFRQAKLIVSDRSDIISDAKKEAESIIRSAEEKTRAMLDEDEMVKQAKLKANDIMIQAQTKSKDMKRAANDYVDDLMKKTDKMLTENLVEFRKTRQNLRSSQK